MTTVKFMEYNDSIGTRTNKTPLTHSINGKVYTPVVNQYNECEVLIWMKN